MQIYLFFKSYRKFWYCRFRSYGCWFTDYSSDVLGINELVKNEFNGILVEPNNKRI